MTVEVRSTVYEGFTFPRERPLHPKYFKAVKDKYPVVTKRISISDIEAISHMGLAAGKFSQTESTPMTESQISQSFEGTQIHYLEMLCALKLQEHSEPITAATIRPHLPTFTPEERQQISGQLNTPTIIEGWSKWRHSFTFPHQDEDVHQPELTRDLWLNTQIQKKAERVVHIWTTLADQNKIKLLHPQINNLHELTGIVNLNFGVQPNCTEMHLQVVTRFDLITNPAERPMETTVFDFKARPPEPTLTHQMQSHLMQICAAALNTEYPFHKAHRPPPLTGPIIKLGFVDPEDKCRLPQFCYKTIDFDRGNFICHSPVIVSDIDFYIHRLAFFATTYKEEIKTALKEGQKNRGYQPPEPIK